MSSFDKPSVVVIGGGTGIHPVLRGLADGGDSRVTAVVSMADSGGSTGRLRDEFGQLPVGDVRMALVALAPGRGAYEELMRELLLYRFSKGEGLSGHNFGNLLMVALTDILGSEAEAVKAVGRLLRVRGRVLPVTADNVHLVATYDDGVVVEGEHDIDEPAPDRVGHRITKLATTPVGTIAPEVEEAIATADLVMLGPGDLYSSVLANCVIRGVSEALCATRAQFLYTTNLMTRPGQTDGMTAADHVREVARYVGRLPDIVLVHEGAIAPEVIGRYAEMGQYPVVDDCDTLPTKVLRRDLIARDVIERQAGDVLVRSLVRGDSAKIAAVVRELLVHDRTI